MLGNPPATTELLYFAYGSNMSTPRLRSRAPSARAVAVASLPGHVLRFHKRGRDGTAKCDAFHSGCDCDTVYGVVFALSLVDKPTLDRYEGLGQGYLEKHVTVTDRRGRRYRALTYYATAIAAGLRPRYWYKEHVLRGALEHGLPDAYITCIRRVDSSADPVPENQRRELSIYPDRRA